MALLLGVGGVSGLQWVERGRRDKDEIYDWRGGEGRGKHCWVEADTWYVLCWGGCVPVGESSACSRQQRQGKEGRRGEHSVADAGTWCGVLGCVVWARSVLAIGGREREGGGGEGGRGGKGGRGEKGWESEGGKGRVL